MALDMCSEKQCNKDNGCQCPLTIPNNGDVTENPMAVLITGSGRISQTFISNIEKALDGLMSPHDCSPGVSLFFEVGSMSDAELHEAVTAAYRGLLEYEFGVYEKAAVDTVDEWKKVINSSKNRLEAKLSKHQDLDTVEMFRAKDFKWTDNMFAALDQLGIHRDCSYVTRQPLWPFTLAYDSELCYGKIRNLPLDTLGYTYICPGRFPNLWVIPNNVLFTKSESEQNNCTWLGECLLLAMAANQSLEDLVSVNCHYRKASAAKFNRYWQGREPFVVNLEGDFFSRNYSGRAETGLELLKKALQFAFLGHEHTTKDNDGTNDVYFEWVSQLIQMSKLQPTNSDIAGGFYNTKPFNCRTGYSVCERFSLYTPSTVISIDLCAAIIVVIACCLGYWGTSNVSLSNKVENWFGRRVSTFLRTGWMWMTLVGSFVTGTLFDSCCIAAFDIAFERVQSACAPGYEDIPGRQDSPRRKKLRKTLWVGLAVLILPLSRAFILAGILAGPVRLWIYGHENPGSLKTTSGLAFSQVLVEQTPMIFIYFLVSTFISFRLSLSLQTLTTLLKGHEDPRNFLGMCKHRVVTRFSALFKASRGSIVAFILVAVGYTFILIPNFVEMNTKSRISGWYGTFDCDTTLMYMSIYSFIFLMGHMSLVFSYSLDRWTQDHLKSVELVESQPSAIANQSSVRETPNPPVSLEKFHEEYKKYYTGCKSILILGVLQLLVGFIPLVAYFEYIKRTFDFVDNTEKALRMSLFFSILIIGPVPYVATWIIHHDYKSKYQKREEKKKQKKTTQGDLVTTKDKTAFGAKSNEETQESMAGD